nr:uncharacterized protein LOC113830234 [Penaeus vannamei]
MVHRDARTTRPEVFDPTPLCLPPGGHQELELGRRQREQPEQPVEGQEVPAVREGAEEPVRDRQDQQRQGLRDRHQRPPSGLQRHQRQHPQPQDLELDLVPRQLDLGEDQQYNEPQLRRRLLREPPEPRVRHGRERSRAADRGSRRARGAHLQPVQEGGRGTAGTDEQTAVYHRMEPAPSVETPLLHPRRPQSTEPRHHLRQHRGIPGEASVRAKESHLLERLETTLLRGQGRSALLLPESTSRQTQHEDDSDGRQSRMYGTQHGRRR